jgi:hypothetical protein
MIKLFMDILLSKAIKIPNYLNEAKSIFIAKYRRKKAS